MPLRLRKALLSDVPILDAWDKEPHVIESGGSDDVILWAEDIDEDPPWRDLLIAETEQGPVGIVYLIDPAQEDTQYWARYFAPDPVPHDLRALDIWIGARENLSKGYGTEMMRQALALCFAVPTVQRVLIDPLVRNSAAIRFYERLGFEALKYHRFGNDECLVHQFQRRDWANPP
ncbi:MAG: GNAT family N-acetyltransferase [Pseudomonadota bacterium]